jgi:hypothetical protein
MFVIGSIQLNFCPESMKRNSGANKRLKDLFGIADEKNNSEVFLTATNYT